MRSTVAIIGVAAAGIVGLTVGAVTSPGGIALADPGNTNEIHAPAPDAMPPGPDGVRAPDGPGRPGPGWRHHPDFKLKLARDLAGLETLIGIRADQLDAWRDYTSALLAVIGPPLPPGAAGEPADGPRHDPEAFGREEHLADATIAKGQSAEKLKAAIETLRQKLTPEQLALLLQAERHMGPPHPHPFFPGPGPQDQRPAPSAERPAPDAG